MANASNGTALITGASTGIGAVYADRLAHRGYDLILVARNRSRLEALATRLAHETGRAIEVLPADLTIRSDLATVERRLAGDRAIAVLVNNAGIALKGGLLENAPVEIERLIALNVTAPTLLAAAAGKAFAERKGGTIVNIASVLALAPEMLEAAYSGSKAFLLNLTLKLALDLKDTGVRVQAVLPGATRTEIWEHAGKDVDKLPAVMEVDELVDAALAGFDRRETVTIPPLPDERQWTAFESARKAMIPNFSQARAAERYRNAAS